MHGEIHDTGLHSRRTAIVVFARDELPSGWRSAALVAPFEAVQLRDAASWKAVPSSCRFWIARHPDCVHLVEALCEKAVEVATKLIFLGTMGWEEQARALEAGAWVLPEPEDPLAFLRWLSAYAEPRERNSIDAPALTVNAALRTAFVAGSKVPLQPRESALLLLLREVGRDGIQPDDLCQRLFGEALPRHRRLLLQHVHRLRAKLGPLGEYITFSRDAGYRCMLRVRLLDVSL